jgi:hypothetical protein
VTTTTLTAYFTVDDISEAVTRVRELGGQAEDPSPEQRGFGRFSTCTDDQGIPFGLRSSSSERMDASEAWWPGTAPGSLGSVRGTRRKAAQRE